MSVHRIILRIAGLSLLSSVLMLTTDCGREKDAGRHVNVTVDCTTTIMVTGQPVAGVDVPDAYVCKDQNTLTWKPASNQTFFVYFKHNDCPFANSDCKKIDNQNAGPFNMKPQPKFKIYDYVIVVDGTGFDPHIIGGGG